MKLIEQSATRLVFQTGLRYLSGARCTFDHGTGRANIKRVMLMWPRKTLDIPLRDIVSVQSSVSKASVEGGTVTTAIPQLTLASGQTVNLSVLAGDTKSAPVVIGAVKTFLGL